MIYGNGLTEQLNLIKKIKEESMVVLPNKKKYWLGSKPIVCQLDGQLIEGTFIDGRLVNGGQWAILCPRCHTLYGVGFGTGKGQRYAKEETSEQYYKVEG